MKKALRTCLILLLVLSTPLQACAWSACQVAKKGYIDYFNDQNARWAWAYGAGTGFHSAPVTDGTNSTAGLGITSATVNTVYSDSSLHDDPGYTYSGVVTARIRVANEGGAYMDTGSWGYGLYDGQSPANSAWFMWMGAGADAAFQGLRAYVIINSTPIYSSSALSTVDTTIYHVYEVHAFPTYVNFVIDGTTVASYSGAFSPANLMRVEIWNDNQEYRSGVPTLLTVGHDEKLYVDWSRWTATE